VMRAPVNEISPVFKSVREKGLNMIDASQLHHIGGVQISSDQVAAASS